MGQTKLGLDQWRARALSWVLGIVLISGLMPAVAFAQPGDAVDANQTLDALVESCIDTSEEDIAALESSGGNLYMLGTDASFANYSADQSRSVLRARSSMPTSFDLRNVDGTVRSTKVKLQNPWGSCWSFGALASVESNLIMQGVETATSADYSERHLAWFHSQPIESRYASHLSSSQVGEGTRMLTDRPFDIGGVYSVAPSMFASGQGIRLESDIPYRNDEGKLDEEKDENGAITHSEYKSEGTWLVSPTERFGAEYQLEEALMLPGPVITDSDGNYAGYDKAATLAMKQALMSYGAVNISYTADQSSPGEAGNSKYFNYEHWAQYTDTTSPLNHSVAIVGWDDFYGVENFNADARPQNPGAWIVKNSWGSKDGGVGNTNSWGIDGTGYFYLSYYDQTIVHPVVYNMATTPEKTYDATYQYDAKGFSSFFSSPLMAGSEVSTANVFTVTDDQMLRAVSAFTYMPNSTVKIEVYRLDREGVAPTDGALLTSKTSTPAYAGYHRIALGEDIAVRTGERIAVVETVYGEIDGAGTRWFIPLEDALSKTAAQESGLPHYEVVVSNPGESFVGSAGAWSETSGLNAQSNMPMGGMRTFGNACIKVFADSADLPPIEPATVLKVEGSATEVSAAEMARMSVTGAVVGDSERMVLSLTDVPSDSPARAAFAALYQEGETRVSTFDLSLAHVSGIDGALTVTLPVPERFEGKQVRVLHYVDTGKLDAQGSLTEAAKAEAFGPLTVKNGVVQVSVYSLSPFEIVLAKEESPSIPPVVPGDSGLEKPLNDAVGGSLAKSGDNAPVAALVLGVMVSGLLIVTAVRRRRDQR